jgi:hypothetical protein
MARLAHYVMASEWRAALMASALLFLPLVSWRHSSTRGVGDDSWLW